MTIKKSPKIKIAIIGGGAAGMMLAAVLLENKVDASIEIFEKNTILGKKVLISGGGRCNVTTAINDQTKLLKNYYRGSRFLQHSQAAFPPNKVINWFEHKGIKLKTEKDLRVFPVSDNGEEVVQLFLNIFKDRLKIHYAEPVKDLFFDNTFNITTENSSYEFDYLVLTTGGNAYAQTGSSGDGYMLAAKLGHTITQLGPSLNSFETSEAWIKELPGISLPNVSINYDDNPERINGPLIFTHFGISGPVVFSLSSRLAFAKISKLTPQKIVIRVEEKHDFQYWEDKLIIAIKNNPQKQILNLISEYLPKNLVKQFLLILKIDLQKQVNILLKTERRDLCHFLAGFTLNLVARRAGDEFVTAGGLDLNEISSKTLRSKINPNLYFAGEILNYDGITGGFNLQGAWATAYNAALAITKEILNS